MVVACSGVVLLQRRCPRKKTHASVDNCLHCKTWSAVFVISTWHTHLQPALVLCNL